MIEILSKKIEINANNEIKEYYTENGNVRALVVDGCIQSVMYIDEKKRYELFNNYLNFFDLPLKMSNSINNCLILGGGAFVYPQYFINNYSNKKITVVEKECENIEIAKKYFYLNESLDKFFNNISIVNDDALKFIKKNHNKYDYINIDLFNGKNPIKEIYSVYAVSNLKRMLSNQGFITANFIISKDNYLTYKKDLQLILKLFKHYMIITDNENFDLEHNYGNIFLIMSNTEFKIPQSYNYIDLTRKILN